MSTDTAPAHGQDHPSPHRAEVSAAALWFAILAGPLAWSMQLLLNAPIAAHGCYPGDVPLVAPIWNNARVVMAGIEIAAICLCVVAGLTGWRCWRRARREKEGSARRLMEGGDGRTRFMAMVGILTSALFLVGIGFSILNLVAVPSCGG